MRLNQSFAENAVNGVYSYGDGLILVVSGKNARSWVARLQYNRVRKDYGLGPVSVVTLYEARTMVREYKRLLREGKDPKVHKQEVSRMAMGYA
jgi:hypothetical protein